MHVAAVSRNATYSFSKPNRESITLVAGLGVDGDVHMGETVKHRSRVARDPNQPNLRQVHLMHSELHAELADAGYTVGPGDLGENITTSGIDLLDLPTGTLLHLGANAVVRVTGLRNPCVQIDRFQKGVLPAVLDRDENGDVVRKAGIMSVVVTGGEVRPGDEIRVELPAQPHERLEPV
ncbi:MOSC domain-containing protein [Allokutzneria sp. A3M-2-11 16]|uniref:MOSC domain-containing protein n=1 Tax=Allokutzneria sp. A3M-2-11 16 TaxID=2962043 RepID=UPI0020B85E02|nr:MOSC domain-containing protein [Allokutzneria sp. A3M-2-11 16]MCP3799902.1 MOSC domain-containing protein [Allokutzneria sp. A3M-2-11 16]